MEEAHRLVWSQSPISMQRCTISSMLPSNSRHQINDSGLKIFSIEDLQNAAEKSVQLSKVVKMGTSASEETPAACDLRCLA